MTIKKLDFKKSGKEYYLPSAGEVTTQRIPSWQFAALSGDIPAGTPVDQDPAFQQAMEALYGISYGLKFVSKKDKQQPIDYVVLPLEGLWWTDSSHLGFDFNRVEDWHYQLLIRQPDHIDEEMFEAARADLTGKKGAENSAIERLRLIQFEEGLSMQVMHLGPYSEEPKTLAKMDAYAIEHGLSVAGRHHEIYLGDPRRAKPENLRTVLRHPVEKV